METTKYITFKTTDNRIVTYPINRIALEAHEWNGGVHYVVIPLIGKVGMAPGNRIPHWPVSKETYFEIIDTIQNIDITGVGVRNLTSADPTNVLNELKLDNLKPDDIDDEVEDEQVGLPINPNENVPQGRSDNGEI